MPLRAYINEEEIISIDLDERQWDDLKKLVKSKEAILTLPCCNQAVYFPTPSIRNCGGTTTKRKQNIEIGLSNNEVSVVIKGGATLNYVQVSDLLGRVISKHSNINSSNFNIPAFKIQKGVYVINVLDSEGKTYTSKLQRL